MQKLNSLPINIFIESESFFLIFSLNVYYLEKGSNLGMFIVTVMKPILLENVTLSIGMILPSQVINFVIINAALIKIVTYHELLVINVDGVLRHKLGVRSLSHVLVQLRFQPFTEFDLIPQLLEFL